MIGLMRSELLKVRTTNMWWLFGIGVAVMTAIAVAWNAFVVTAAVLELPRPDTTNMDPAQAKEQLAFYESQANIVARAADIFTSGQYFGGLFVVLIGVLLITNEFHHQTATATFLTTPARSAVMAAKLGTAMLFAAGFWLISTIINLVVGVLFFQSRDISNHLGDWPVQRAILFNLLVFALWAALGLGFGTLVRSKIGATVTSIVLYTIGTTVVGTVFYIVRENLIKEDWVLEAQIVVPSVAAQVFTTPTNLPDTPPYWVGGLVMLGYGVLSGAIGTLIMRRRDIS